MYANPPMPTADARSYYFGTLEPLFISIKGRAQDVLELNQAAIVRADERAKAEARRASVTSFAVTVGALLLAVVLAARVIRVSFVPFNEQQLHLAQRMSDAALTSLYDPVVVTDSLGRIVHVNRAAEGVFGALERLVGSTVSEVIPEAEITKEVRGSSLISVVSLKVDRTQCRSRLARRRARISQGDLDVR